MSRISRFCDGLTRRDCLRVGAAGLFGLTLPGLLERQARAAEQGKPTKDVSLIFVFLHGGLSTIDTWDLKPDAPVEFRGDFKPIDTNVNGIRVVRTRSADGARQMDKSFLIRSFRHHNSDQCGPADHYIHTGHFPQAGFNPNLKPNNQKPACTVRSSLASSGRAAACRLMSVCRKCTRAPAPAYLSAGCFSLRYRRRSECPGLRGSRMRRRRLHPRRGPRPRARIQAAEVDRFHEVGRVGRQRSVLAPSALIRKKAFAARDDFQGGEESTLTLGVRTGKAPRRVRPEFAGTPCLDGTSSCRGGRPLPGQHRLTATGTPTITTSATLKGDLLPAAGRQRWRHCSADLAGPRISSTATSGHASPASSGEHVARQQERWPRLHRGPAFTVALGGGGIKGGRVVGKSDGRAEKPASDPFGPEDLCATHVSSSWASIRKTSSYTPEGRPALVKIVRSTKKLGVDGSTPPPNPLSCIKGRNVPSQPWGGKVGIA